MYCNVYCNWKINLQTTVLGRGKSQMRQGSGGAGTLRRCCWESDRERRRDWTWRSSPHLSPGSPGAASPPGPRTADDAAAGIPRVRPRVLCSSTVHRGGEVTGALQGGAGKAMTVSVTPCDKDSPRAGFEDRGTVHMSWGARAERTPTRAALRALPREAACRHLAVSRAS